MKNNNVLNSEVKPAKYLSKWHWCMAKIRKYRSKIYKRILEYLVYMYPDEAERHVYNFRMIEQKKMDEELESLVISPQDCTEEKLEDEEDLSEVKTEKFKLRRL
jgi:hypothetical protein